MVRRGGRRTRLPNSCGPSPTPSPFARHRQAKECIAIVLDVSDAFKPHLDDALQAVRSLVNSKILFHGKDAIGIFAHGTELTENALAQTDEHEGQYQHVSEIHCLGPVSHKTLGALDRVAGLATAEADLIDSLTLAVHAVIQHTGKLKWQKRVLVLTDGTSPAQASEEELAQICGEMSKGELKLEVYGAGFDPAAPPPAEPVDAEDDPDGAAREATCELLRAMRGQLGEPFFAFHSMSGAWQATAPGSSVHGCR